MQNPAPHIAVVGAGPVGLALALHAARVLPAARITVFDARPAERDVAADPRTLALSLGSVQFLQRLVDWTPPQAIAEVQVSQQPPSFGDAEVHIRAAELGVPLLGAVIDAVGNYNSLFFSMIITAALSLIPIALLFRYSKLLKKPETVQVTEE